jgi:hypothetical protein
MFTFTEFFSLLHNFHLNNFSVCITGLKYIQGQAGRVVGASIPSHSEAKVGGLQVQGQLDHVVKHCLKLI